MTAKEFLHNGLYCKSWICNGECKAVLQIVHGLGEMSEYYEQTAEYLADRGVSVYMSEMRYHGRTKLPTDVDDITSIMADESYSLTTLIKSASDSPVFLLGHSLGADIAQLMLKKHSDSYKACILTGCAFIPDTKSLLQKLDEEIKESGEDSPCIKVFMDVFGRVAERFPEKCTTSWATSDLERALHYEKLPYTNVMYSNRFYKSFLTLAHMTQKSDFPQSIAVKIPLFIACGSEDSVGGYGEYPPVKAEEYRKAGFAVTLKMYDSMRHSVLQEKERETVYADILEFIEHHLPDSMSGN